MHSFLKTYGFLMLIQNPKLNPTLFKHSLKIILLKDTFPSQQ